MTTNVSIKPDLLDEAFRLGEHRTKREAVHKALIEYIARLKRRAAVESFGTFDFAEDWDHKKLRKLR